MCHLFPCSHMCVYSYVSILKFATVFCIFHFSYKAAICSQCLQQGESINSTQGTSDIIGSFHLPLKALELLTELLDILNERSCFCARVCLSGCIYLPQPHISQYSVTDIFFFFIRNCDQTLNIKDGRSQHDVTH